jgi:hypothetical protein
LDGREVSSSRRVEAEVARIAHGRSGIVRRSRTLDVSLLDRHAWHEAHARVVRNDCFQHLRVQEDIKVASAHGSHLTEHNVFRNATAVIKLTSSSRLQKNFDRLLE